MRVTPVLIQEKFGMDYFRQAVGFVLTPFIFSTFFEF